MSKFNDDKPYHGSDAVEGGKLWGSTLETDYFYFFCPKCENHHVMRILDHGEHGDQDKIDTYDEHVEIKADHGFSLAFKLYCENCKHTDFVKLFNGGWQKGHRDEILQRFHN